MLIILQYIGAIILGAAWAFFVAPITSPLFTIVSVVPIAIVYNVITHIIIDYLE